MGDDGRIQTLNRCDKSPEPQNRIPVLRNLLTSNHLRPHNFGLRLIILIPNDFLKQIKPELNYFKLIVMRLDFISIISFLFKAIIGYRSRKDYLDMTGPCIAVREIHKLDSSPFVTFAGNEISRTLSKRQLHYSFSILCQCSCESQVVTLVLFQSLPLAVASAFGIPLSATSVAWMHWNNLKDIEIFSNGRRNVWILETIFSEAMISFSPGTTASHHHPATSSYSACVLRVASLWFILLQFAEWSY